jgi:hypothetical protein
LRDNLLAQSQAAYWSVLPLFIVKSGGLIYVGDSLPLDVLKKSKLETGRKQMNNANN